MKILKEYLFISLLLVVVLSLLFIQLIDGSNIFTSGDSLSPISIKNSIKYFYNTNNSFPLWFPWILGGIPTVHSFLYISDYYFPHQFMVFLNNLGVPWVWYFIFHLIFGGLGIYYLLRFLNQNYYSSFFGSILFVLMPYMVTMTAYGHGSQMMSCCYIPWIILFLFKIYDNYDLFNLGVFSLLIGLQLQRGHIQVSYHTWMMIGLFILISVIKKIFKEKNNILNHIKIELLLLLSLIIGLMLSFSLYNPILNYSSYSIRGSYGGGAGLEYATQWSMSIKEFITLLFPYSLGFGGPLYFGDLPFTDFPNYISILIIVLSVIGLYKSKLRTRYKVFFSLSIIFSLLISLGENFIQFYKIFYNYFPHFNKFRVPAYILIITNFSFLVLASCGLNVMGNSIIFHYRKNKYIYIILFIGLFLSVIYAFFGNVLIPTNNIYKGSLSNLINNDSYILFIILLATTSIYVISNYKKSFVKLFYLLIILFCSYDYYRIDKEIIKPKFHIPHKQIIQSKGYLDKFLIKDELTSYFLKDTTKFRIIDFVGHQNRWSVYNIENINGYHPAKLNNYNNFINHINQKGYQLWPEGILRLLNIKYLVLPNSKFKHSSFTNHGKQNMYYFGNDRNYDGENIDVNLYQYNNFFPRLFYTNNIKYLNDNDIYDNILIDNYNPFEIVYLNEKIEDEFTFNDLNRSVELVLWNPDRIEFKTTTNSKQFLVISEIYYPLGWEVKSNNKEFRIYEVNNLVRGIIVPKGENYFIMQFSPTDINNGLLISKLGYLLIIIIFALYYYKFKQ